MSQRQDKRFKKYVSQKRQFELDIVMESATLMKLRFRMKYAYCILFKRPLNKKAKHEKSFVRKLRKNMFKKPILNLIRRKKMDNIGISMEKVDVNNYKDIELQEVKSGNVAAVGYDKKTCILRVKFRNNSEYIYTNVPPEKAEALLTGKESIGEKTQNISIGAYFNRQISRNYIYRQILSKS